MSTIATLDSLWRYPIKSMRGEELNEAFVGFSGIYGDRLFAFRAGELKDERLAEVLKAVPALVDVEKKKD